MRGVIYYEYYSYDYLFKLVTSTFSNTLTLWVVKIRYLSPTIVFTTMLSMINSFKVFREVYLLTGEYPFGTMYMLQHYMNNTFASADYQKLSTAAVYMSAVMIVIIGILLFAEHLYGKDFEES